MQLMMGRLAAGLILASTLAACGDEAATSEQRPPAEQGGTAAGEVLGGSISDAMIPLESLTSQSPPLREPKTTGTTTVTTQVSEDGTSVSTTVETTTGASDDAPTPAPPQPPATPGGLDPR